MVVPAPRPASTYRSRTLLNLARVLLSLAVGVPLVVLWLTLLTGSLEAVLQLLLFSVVCTLGIGGLFWLGLAFGVGFLTLHLVRLLPGSGKGAVTGATQRQRDRDAVALYVSRRLQQGGDLALIQRDLKQAGWDASQIDAAVAAASPAGAER
jgi:hypothetical protein